MTPPDPRFARVEQAFRYWRQELAAGRLVAGQVEAGLEREMFELGGRWWAIGASSGKWYAYDGRSWVESQPPPARKSRLALAGCFTLIALAMIVGGAVLTARSILAGAFRADDSYEGLMIIGTFLLATSITAVMPRVLSILLLLAASTWALAGFVAVQMSLGRGLPFWWWPDLTFATGLAGVAGTFLAMVVKRLMSR